MKEIPLTKGQVALVDDEDYEMLDRYKWQASYDPKLRSYYAIRKTSVNPRKNIRMHRVILSVPFGLYVDHRNHNTLDNTRANLRVCTRSQNAANMVKILGGLSDYKGVKKEGQRWVSTININGKHLHLGCFGTEEEAAFSYDEAAVHYFGEFARTNAMLGLL
jgi:hypothetical protein